HSVPQPVTVPDRRARSGSVTRGQSAENDGGDSFMKIRHDFPFAVSLQEHVWIPMPDGARLAARIWIPKGAERNPVPAILEYIPYRKRDYTRIRDGINHPWFAGHGYAS